MAKVKGMAATNYVGKLGPAVFYMRHGVNINRALAAEVANPQTAEQMTQRNRLTNVVRANQANKIWMELFGYENVPQGRTLYNEFVSQNLPISFVYLTKAEVAAYTSILAPYLFTRGTLPRITSTFVSSLTVASSLRFMDSWGDIKTVADFTREFLSRNSNWQEGDQLSVVVNAYRADSLPMVHAYELTLDSNDTRAMDDMPITGVLNSTLEEGEYRLGLDLTDISAGTPLGVLFCQSRKQGGKVLVSTQNLVLNEPATTMFTEYSGAAAQQRARRSYGGVGDPFLYPGDQPIDVKPQTAVTFIKEYPIATGAVAGTTITAQGSFTGNEVLDYLAAHLTFNGGTIRIVKKHSESEGDDYYPLVDGSGKGVERNILSANGNVATIGSGSSIATLSTAEWDGEQIEP